MEKTFKVKKSWLIIWLIMEMVNQIRVSKFREKQTTQRYKGTQQLQMEYWKYPFSAINNIIKINKKQSSPTF